MIILMFCSVGIDYVCLHVPHFVSGSCFMANYFCQIYTVLFAPLPFLCIYLWSDVNELNNNVDGCKTPLVVVCNTGMEILGRLRFGDKGNERCTITMVWRHCFPAVVAFLSSNRSVPRTLSHSYLCLPYQCSSLKCLLFRVLCKNKYLSLQLLR